MRPRTATALGILTAGVVLTGYAGGTYARGWLAQESARTAWDAKLAHAAVERARATVTDRSSDPEPTVGAPVARLVIPRVGLDDIVLEGVTDEALNGGPGHLPGSVMPGAQGNSVVSAHRDRHFRRLGELSLGDTITTYTERDTVTWRVIARTVVNRGSPALHREAAPVLTLTTCWPIGYLGGAPERLIIKAVPITPPRSISARVFAPAHSS